MYSYYQLRAYEHVKLCYFFQSGQVKASQMALLKKNLWSPSPNEADIFPYLNNYCDFLLQEGNMQKYKEDLLRVLQIGKLKMANAILSHLCFYLHYSKVTVPYELDAFIDTILVKYPYQHSMESHITSIVLPYLKDYLNTDEKTRLHRVSIIEGSNNPILVIEMRTLLLNFKPITVLSQSGNKRACLDSHLS